MVLDKATVVRDYGLCLHQIARVIDHMMFHHGCHESGYGAIIVRINGGIWSACHV